MLSSSSVSSDGREGERGGGMGDDTEGQHGATVDDLPSRRLFAWARDPGHPDRLVTGAVLNRRAKHNATSPEIRHIREK